MINDYTILSAGTAIVNEKKLEQFLKGLTTPHEREEFAKRIRIVSLLRQGLPQHEIAKNLGVGVATVSRGHKEEKAGLFDEFFSVLPKRSSKTFQFGGSAISSIFKGGWQLSGGHGTITRKQAIEDMVAYAEQGVNVLDTGDIYGDSEMIIGDFLRSYRKSHGASRADQIRIHTKFVPDLNALDDLTFYDVEKVIYRSKERLGVAALDLVQFHWWDYERGDFVQAAKWLKRLQDQGHIKQIGLTNFDCAHTQLLIDSGIPVASNQIQFSIFDPRGLNGMLEMAQRNNFAIFCYGVLAGGLIETEMSETNRSHIKYSLVIEEVGEAYYRKAIQLLESMSVKYETTRSNIAIAYALQTQGVSAVILGPRNKNHLDKIKDVPLLDTSDYLVLRRLHSHQQYFSDDDIYSYERIINGKHGRIMKYNQNGMRV